MGVRIRSEQLKKIMGESVDPPLKPKTNKYKVSAPEHRTYRGKVYDSKAEMRYRRDILDPQLLAGETLCVLDQPRVVLAVNDATNAILTAAGIDFAYKPDFLVIRRDGPAYFVDVKGVETDRFRQAASLWRDFGPMPLMIVKLTGKEFTTSEVIQRGRRLP